MKDFYNTTNLSGVELYTAQGKAKTQSRVIMGMFRRPEWSRLSPKDIMNLTDDQWPITSVRRTLTNLTKDGLLIKTEDKVTGMYGSPEHVWRIATKND